MNHRNAAPVLLRAVLGLLLLAGGTAAARGQCYYSWERIRLPGNTQAVAGTCINDAGTVAGFIDSGGDTLRAFVWTPETGVQQLPLPPGIIDMSARAINNWGQVVGVMSSGSAYYIFIWEAATGYTTISLPQPAGMVYVRDINDRGEIVGSLYRRTPPGPWHWEPFVWQNGQFTFLGDLVVGAENAFGEATNERGEIVGYAYEPGTTITHAFLIRDRTQLTWLEEPIGFSQTQALELNNNGIIVGRGYSATEGLNKAVAWTPWGIATVPPRTIESAAIFVGVNDAGRALGNYFGSSSDRPFIWQFGLTTELRTLFQPGPSLPATTAYAINSSGTISTDTGGYTLRATPHWLTGDITGDCHVTIDDLSVLLAQFGTQPETFPLADLNADRAVELDDLALLLMDFGL